MTDTGTESVGGTEMFLCSHRSQTSTGFGAAARLLGASCEPRLHCGDAVVYDYHLRHRGQAFIANESNGNDVRTLIQFVYSTSGDDNKSANFGTKRLMDDENAVYTMRL